MAATRGREIAMVYQNPLSLLEPGHDPSAINWSRRSAPTRASLEPLPRPAPFGSCTTSACPSPSGASRATRTSSRREAPTRRDRDGAGPRTRTLLIADEPTTALDVISRPDHRAAAATARRARPAVILVSHDLGTGRGRRDRVRSCPAGTSSSTVPRPLHAHPPHPYTRGLLGSVLVAGVPGRAAGPRDPRPARCRVDSPPAAVPPTLPERDRALPGPAPEPAAR